MYYKKLKINGKEFEIAVNIGGSGAPTAETEAASGMFYVDEDTGKVYVYLGKGEWKPLIEEFDPTSAIEEALAEAKASGEFDGEDGKSAYAYATEGGYGKTEEEFYKDLGGIKPPGGDIILSDSVPLMDGEASPGVSGEASRADHTHPPDITRMPAISEMVQDAISDESKIPFEEHLSKTMKYVTWKRILELVNVAAYFYNASNDTPLMNGVASAGTAEKFSKSDHVHPVDTSRMSSNISTLEKLFSRGRTLENEDKLIVGDSKDEISKYCTWAEIISEIGKYVVPKISDALETAVVEAARAVCTEDGAIYATLPDDITEDAVLALRSDLLKYYTVSEINSIVAGLQPKGEYLVPQDLTAHNTGEDSHNDIRLLIKGLSDAVNHFLDIDDETKDQASELIQLIEDNATQIESITSGKVNVADIVNNLTTNVTNKPLSAAQGVALKALIDAITVPTKLSELTGDATHRTVTDTEKSEWNSKSNFSGKYADLSGKPTIPSSPSDIGAQPAGNYALRSEIPSVPVQSVNDKTGAVTLTASDVGAAPSDKTITITGVDENGATHTWTIYGVKS